MAQIFERRVTAWRSIVYTDISRDGMMQGVNIQATVELAQAVAIPVIASGGISSLADIRALCEVRQEGIMGAINRPRALRRRYRSGRRPALGR